MNIVNKNAIMVPLLKSSPISLIADISDTKNSIMPAEDSIKSEIKMVGVDVFTESIKAFFLFLVIRSSMYLELIKTA